MRGNQLYIILLCALSIIIAYSAMRLKKDAPCFYLISDPLLAPHAHECCKYALQQISSQQFAFKIATQSLYAACPALKRIECRYTSSTHATITVAAWHPLIVVNDDFVILENGALVKKIIFEQEHCQQLPIITTTPNDIASLINNQPACRAILDVPLAVFNNFHLTWIDATTIWLESRLYRVKIRANQASLQPTILEHCQRLMPHIAPTSQHHMRIADIRFKNQIIVT